MSALSDSDRLALARSKVDKLNVLTLRAIVANWLAADEISLGSPVDLAQQILYALDAVAVVLDIEKESAGVDEAFAFLRAKDAEEAP